MCSSAPAVGRADGGIGRFPRPWPLTCVRKVRYPNFGEVGSQVLERRRRMTQFAVGTKNRFAAIARTAGTRFSWTKADRAEVRCRPGAAFYRPARASGCYHGRFHRGALPLRS
jgi:hypothetical protein